MQRIAILAGALLLIATFWAAFLGPSLVMSSPAQEPNPPAQLQPRIYLPIVFGPSWPTLALTPLVSGLSSPVHITHAGDGSGRLFVVEQLGRIRIVREWRAAGYSLPGHREPRRLL